MYTTTIIPTSYMKRVLREAENKSEIKAQIREITQETLEEHKWWNNTVQIRAQDDEYKTETLFFTIKIIEWKSINTQISKPDTIL